MLNSWQVHENSGAIRKELCLTPNTSKGLRVTIHSVIELSRHLFLENCHYQYVFTGKMNQDPLEVCTYIVSIIKF